MDKKEFITQDEKEYIAKMFWLRLQACLKLKEEKKDNGPKYIFYS
jgi:hypothetical protein